MDYEKKYKEALLKIRELINKGKENGLTIISYEKYFEDVFPELKESDDERIRKGIISGMKALQEKGKCTCFANIPMDDVFAWLEKQGEQEQLYIRFGEIPTNEKSKIFQGEIEVGTENGVSVYPAFKTSEGDIVLGLSLPITKTTLYTQQHLIEYDDRPCYLVKGDYVGKDTDGQPLINNVSIIEKIDTYRVKEKKQDNEPKASYTTIVETGDGGINALVTKELPTDGCDDEQKPTDKLEPKFKVGDWVVDNCGNVWKIEGILNQFYILECVEGGESRPTIEWVNKTFHLWTIKDAKDGDVLVYHNTVTEIIMLFKSWVVDREAAYTHFHIFDNDCRVLGSCDCGNGAHPATKEQRDLLFQKMKEAGYEWDSEKKGLRKIEQKPTQEIEPFEAEHGKYYYCIKDYFCGGRKQASKGDVVQALRGLPIMGLKDASEYFLPVNSIKCNSTWSEEDEENFRDIIGAIHAVAYQTTEDEEARIEWVKSIKQRMGNKL